MCCSARRCSRSRSGRSCSCRGLIGLSESSKGRLTRGADPPLMTPRDRTATGRFRVLVIANETAADEALHDLVTDHIGAMSAEVLVVAPAAFAGRTRVETVDAARAR